MADIKNHLEDDDHELDRARQLWRDYGKPILGGVIIAAAGVLGWHWWQDHQASRSEAASTRYNQLVTLVGSSQSLDEKGRSAAQDVIDQLEGDYGDTLYGDLAGLIEARVKVDAGDLDGAGQALSNLIDRSDRDFIEGLARLALARVQLAESHADQALATLGQHELPDALASRALDIRGDVLRALDRPGDARKAWQQALETARNNNQPAYGIQFKLDDLAIAEAS